MTHSGGKDLARSFRQVRGNTIQTAEDIPGDKYGFQASPDTRSIGDTLVHLVPGVGRVRQEIAPQERLDAAVFLQRDLRRPAARMSQNWTAPSWIRPMTPSHSHILPGLHEGSSATAC